MQIAVYTRNTTKKALNWVPVISCLITVNGTPWSEWSWMLNSDPDLAKWEVLYSQSKSCSKAVNSNVNWHVMLEGIGNNISKHTIRRKPKWSLIYFEWCSLQRQYITLFWCSTNYFSSVSIIRLNSFNIVRNVLFYDGGLAYNCWTPGVTTGKGC